MEQENVMQGIELMIGEVIYAILTSGINLIGTVAHSKQGEYIALVNVFAIVPGGMAIRLNTLRIGEHAEFILHDDQIMYYEVADEKKQSVYMDVIAAESAAMSGIVTASNSGRSRTH